jgi:histidinol-phosphate phosphatase family domain/HAD-superfamily hydrolase, subfamily IIIA
VTHLDGLHLLPRAAEAVRRIRSLGLAAVVVTNQSGVGRGLMTEEDLHRVHARLIEGISEAGGALDRIMSCTHAPWDGCACRKPAPGMLLRARDELDLSLQGSYFVGDKATDIECGAAVGCTTILVLSGLDPVCDLSRFVTQPDVVATDLWAAVEWIAEREQSASATFRDATEEPR